MPYAVTHIIIPMLIVAIYRDYFAKHKFSKFYVVIAGIAGLLPDIDIILYWIINLFKYTPINMVHRWIFHTVFLPMIFFIIALAIPKKRMLFFMIGFGASMHLLLDYLFSGYIRPFYPFLLKQYGLNLFGGTEMGNSILLGMDAILLTLWLWWEYKRKRIKDFV
ncbi:metal-dependent hydrolase [Candidatus Woesearchaeota archaeon]|nr:MAG: metal-dependent hydrolase [Candidatus Woesearchaeota archaeon]